MIDMANRPDVAVRLVTLKLCFTHDFYSCLSRSFGLSPLISNPGAGEGNRTLVFSLEGCCSAIELHPRGLLISAKPIILQPRRPAARGSLHHLSPVAQASCPPLAAPASAVPLSPAQAAWAPLRRPSL